jgi:RHS repeat-associated protein
LAIETDSSGGTSTSTGFVQGPDFTPLALPTGGQTDSYALDTVDGVASVVTPQGAIAGEYDYDPFGNPRSDGTASVAPTVNNPIKFAGGYQDPTLGGDYTSVARAYDPSTGRFNGVDPVGQSDKDPSASPYAYVARPGDELPGPVGRVQFRPKPRRRPGPGA